MLGAAGTAFVGFSVGFVSDCWLQPVITAKKPTKAIRANILFIVGIRSSKKAGRAS